MRNLQIPKPLALLPLILALGLTAAFAKPVEPVGADTAITTLAPTAHQTERQATCRH